MNKADFALVEKLAKEIHLDDKTIDDAKALFNQFVSKQINQAVTTELDTVQRCALYASTKIQIYPTVGDNLVRGCGVSITQFLKGQSNISISQFLSTLRRFIEFIDIPNDTRQEIKQLIHRFFFIYTLFIKYSDIFSGLKIQNVKEKSSSAIDLVKTFGWLLFIYSRKEIFNFSIEVIDNALLLLIILHFICLTLPKNYKSETIEELIKGKEEEEDFMILDYMAKLFKTQQNLEPLQEIKMKLYSVVEKLSSLGLLKISNKGNCFERMEREYLDINIKSLINIINQKLALEEFDERMFVIGEDKIVTPTKIQFLTPFSRHITANRKNYGESLFRTTSGERTLESKRKLMYEANTPLISNLSMGSKLSDMNFESPTISPLSKHFITSTPISKAMEVSNWLIEQIKKSKENIIEEIITSYSKEKNVPISIFPNVNKLLTDLVLQIQTEFAKLKQTKIDPSSKIPHLFKRILELLIQSEEAKLGKDTIFGVLKNEYFYKSILVCVTETVLITSNIISISFESILDMVQISAFEFWKIISCFLKYDHSMPAEIKKRFRDLEVKIISELAWKNDSPVLTMLNYVIEKNYTKASSQNLQKENINADTKNVKKENNLDFTQEGSINKMDQPQEEKSNNSSVNIQTNFSLNNDENKEILNKMIPYQMFFKRVLHFISQKIMYLTDNLKIEDNEAKEKIWEAMKYCLGSEFNLLIGRNLDQIIVCCIYAILRLLFPNNYTFNHIINTYMELYYSMGDTHKIFYRVKLNDKEEGDIIKFYNTIFIEKCKETLISLCKSKIQNKPPIAKPVFQFLSPAIKLSEIAPPQVLLHTIDWKQQGISNQGKQKAVLSVKMTPKTECLYSNEGVSYRSHLIIHSPNKPISAQDFKNELISNIKGKNDDKIKKTDSSIIKEEKEENEIDKDFNALENPKTKTNVSQTTKISHFALQNSVMNLEKEKNENNQVKSEPLSNEDINK